MASSSKYADLPGIAFDQPDVFETIDPKRDSLDTPSQWQDASEDINDPIIENLTMSMSDAREKFKDKNVSLTPYSDFSDRIQLASGETLSRMMEQRGYVAWSGDIEMINKSYRSNLAGSFEVIGESSSDQMVEETVLQKFNRLTCEVKDLVREVDMHKDENPRKMLLQSVHHIQKLLSNLNVNTLRPSSGDDSIPNDQLQNTIQEKLNSVKEEDVEFDVFIPPHTIKDTNINGVDLGTLDAKLNRIERIVGIHEVDNFRDLQTATGNSKSLLEAVRKMNQRAILLGQTDVDKDELSHVDARLALILSKMNEIQDLKKSEKDCDEKKQNPIDKSVIEKVEKVYEMCMECEGNVSTILPPVIERLEALQKLHDKASFFDATLENMTDLSSKLKSDISSNSELLDELRSRLKSNEDQMTSSLELIQSKIEKLNEKNK